MIDFVTKKTTLVFLTSSLFLGLGCKQRNSNLKDLVTIGPNGQVYGFKKTEGQFVVRKCKDRTVIKTVADFDLKCPATAPKIDAKTGASDGVADNQRLIPVGQFKSLLTTMFYIEDVKALAAASEFKDLSNRSPEQIAAIESKVKELKDNIRELEEFVKEFPDSAAGANEDLESTKALLANQSALSDAIKKFNTMLDARITEILKAKELFYVKYGNDQDGRENKVRQNDRLVLAMLDSLFAETPASAPTSVPAPTAPPLPRIFMGTPGNLDHPILCVMRGSTVDCMNLGNGAVIAEGVTNVVDVTFGTIVVCFLKSDGKSNCVLTEKSDQEFLAGPANEIIAAAPNVIFKKFILVRNGMDGGVLCGLQASDSIGCVGNRVYSVGRAKLLNDLSNENISSSDRLLSAEYASYNKAAILIQSAQKNKAVFVGYGDDFNSKVTPVVSGIVNPKAVLLGGGASCIIDAASKASCVVEEPRKSVFFDGTVVAAADMNGQLNCAVQFKDSSNKISCAWEGQKPSLSQDIGGKQADPVLMSMTYAATCVSKAEGIKCYGIGFGNVKAPELTIPAKFKGFVNYAGGLGCDFSN